MLYDFNNYLEDYDNNEVEGHMNIEVSIFKAKPINEINESLRSNGNNTCNWLKSTMKCLGLS